MSDPFYDTLTPVSVFDALTRPEVYAPLPGDWWIGVADIANSTQAIEQGAYKTVNMVGAAVISAQRNAHGGEGFPFVFGGDGASFAVPDAAADASRDALRAVQAWARDAFGLHLRAAMVPVAGIRAGGRDVRVARYSVTQAVDYAMFSGGGMAWAESELKAGRIGMEPAATGVMPDLTGLSCRWSNMKARHGRIVSLLVLPEDNADPAAFAALCGRVLALTSALDRGGHPVPEDGPPVAWPPPGTELEMAVTGRGRLALLAETFMIWVIMKTGRGPSGFDVGEYVRTTARNADFRKFDDGLKMTLDCDAATVAALKAMLDDASGVARYGLEEQDEAMMTCIVPSAFGDDHLHFVDGASGGYTRAAARLKGRD
ncbi:MAG: adenylate cyclase [Rhodobacteraceae bacterium]|nr:adenylate cyclase [Paracoccaceae bacterium]MAY48219.1 adenylate cyclase [Paracoccaceae bacterium]